MDDEDGYDKFLKFIKNGQGSIAGLEWVDMEINQRSDS